MRINAIHLRHFRSLDRASLTACAALNVLIGRNNAGKSSILTAIELSLDRLQGGKAASLWQPLRPSDEFTGRDLTKPFQIGLTFEAKPAIIADFLDRLLKESPGLDVAVQQLSTGTNFSVIFSAHYINGSIIIYVQEAGIGTINDSGGELTISGTRVISIPQAAAIELGQRELTIQEIETDLKSLDDIPSHVIEYAIIQKGDDFRWRAYGGEKITNKRLIKVVDDLFRRSSTKEDFENGRLVIKNDLKKDIQDITDTEMAHPITTFSGTSKRIPDYIPWLMKALGDGKVVSFKEVRKSVGRAEARQLLELKLRRGGTQSLSRIQDTVRALLGVTVDAFQADAPLSYRVSQPVNAEMDIDDFIVEANGAGIREALRIILDLELGSPVLATVEEPEVHLHPGLERIIHRYLVEKSRDMQLFVATHSANFLDSTTRQNVYLVSRQNSSTSNVEKVASENDLLTISHEIGLRPSTVLMFDRLVFVEGPSDEGIITELTRTMSRDFASVSATFVQMSGSTGFNHYAADATIDLLSRRRVLMWFIIDNDERTDLEIKKMTERIGTRATVSMLKRREIENYLLVPSAVSRLIEEKSSTSGRPVNSVDVDEVRRHISEVAEGLLERTVDLNVSRKLLTPIYAKYGGSTIVEKLGGMMQAIEERVQNATAIEEGLRSDLSDVWAREAKLRAPGSEILDGVLARYGLRYNKIKDGPKLARYLTDGDIDQELRGIIAAITDPSRI